MRTYLLVLTALLGMSSRAGAHALGAQCKLRADKVELEAYFDDDTPARDARAYVEDADKRVMAEGRTDAKGRWSFPRPPSGRYLVIVDAGAGHRSQVKVTIPAGAPSPGAASSEPPAPTISEGPSREEFTRFPWLKVSIGLAVIGGLGVAFWVGRRGRSKP